MRNSKTITTSIIPLLKTFTIILFVILPILGFYVGLIYEKNINLSTQSLIKNSTLLQENKIITWEKYVNNKFGYSFEYPSDWTINTSEANGMENYPQLSSVRLTHNGYMFFFGYNLGGIGGINVAITKKQSIMIDNKFFMKEYLSCPTENEFMNGTSFDSSCLKSAGIIIIQNNNVKNDIYKGVEFGGNFPFINGEISQIEFSFPRTFSFDSVNFEIADTIFSHILNSMKLPTAVPVPTSIPSPTPKS